MPNTKDWKGDQLKFLIIGDTGQGKTKFATTFPKPYMFSFDGGVDTAAGLDIDYDLYIESNRKQPTAYQRFLKDWERVSKDTKYETLILDNISNLSKYIMDELIYINQLVDKNLGDKTWDLYRILKNKMHDIITMSLTATKYVVCTALPEWEVDKNSGEMRILPCTEGRFRQEIPSWFGEVYYTMVDKDTKTGQRQYRLKTKGDGKYIAKSRIDEFIKRKGGKGMPEYLDPPTFETIQKIIGGN